MKEDDKADKIRKKQGKRNKRMGHNNENTSDKVEYTNGKIDGEHLIEEMREVGEVKSDIHRVLCMVIDKPVHGLINYFRECGINISNIYNNIEDVRDALLIETNPCRIIVVETGTGRFATIKARQNIVDMIGICDENNKVSVFYTESAIKTESIRKLGKDKKGLDWYKYKGSLQTAIKILEYNEKYELNKNADKKDKKITKEQLSNVMGLRYIEDINIDKDMELWELLEVGDFDIEDLGNKTMAVGGAIVGYEVNI